MGAIEVIQSELLTTDRIPDQLQWRYHSNRLASLGHPLAQSVEIRGIHDVYKTLEDFGFLWKVLPSSLRKLKYTAGFCIDPGWGLNNRKGKRHSCVNTWFGNPVVYVGDIPESALDNLEKARSFSLRRGEKLWHFTLHSNQPLPVKVMAPGLVGRITQVKEGVIDYLEQVDPVLVVWPVPPRIGTGSIGANNHLWSAQGDFPGVVVSTWDMDQE